MNAPVIAGAVPSRADVPPWRNIVAPLCLGVVLICLVFYQEAALAVQTWLDSTAYNHCFLVVPITLYLLWDRKSELAAVAPAPLPAAALLAVPVAIVWLMAERLGIMEGRQLAVITFLQVLFLGVLGWRLYKACLGPLLYLYFLVPFGEFLTPRLQDVTTWFIRHGLAILGIPAYIDGYIIEIPQGTFFVAEACAGLRFLIASIAFGVLYALMMYRSPVRRSLFIVASIIVPIIANGFRGLGIVLLGWVLGSAQAAAADHVLYGWIFFSAVILLLILLGLPFREDTLPDAASLPEPARGHVAPGPGYAVSFGVAVIAALGPAITMGLAMAGTMPTTAPLAFQFGPDCATVPVATPVTNIPGSGTQRIVCNGIAFDLYWQALSPRATAGALMAARRRLIRPVLTENLAESWLSADSGPPRTWRLMHADDPAYAVAVGLWVDGAPVRPGLTMRARMALDSLVGSQHMPLVMAIVPALAWDTVDRARMLDAVADLKALLAAHPGFDNAVGETTALR